MNLANVTFQSASDCVYAKVQRVALKVELGVEVARSNFIHNWGVMYIAKHYEDIVCLDSPLVAVTMKMVWRAAVENLKA